ncbi:hypothetical protein [Variovorax terrae]|uniref:Uncharacterized protein n=1 Tax=Variovorax terrae TaxID=2923278 RepID=A0A9X1VXM6_9BURK|nr:hypothetical protein [Variovorax terrae]MCJ0765178.1 hypothetical protein [Variovorax terrae]
MKTLAISVLCALAATAALAKLPPLSDEAKAKAAEAAAKTAWSGKVDAWQLCKAQDQVAASYFKAAKAQGKEAKPPAATPACADPGPFAYVPPEAKPPAAPVAPSPPGKMP